MNKVKTLTIFLLTAVLSVALLAKGVSACSYLYEVCVEYGEVYVDKKVSLPRENSEDLLVFKDNLSDIEEERYQKDQIVVFEIKVKNVGDETLNKVTVKDKYPEYIDFPSDDENWDDATNIYTYEIADLESGEEDVKTIEGRVTTDARICVVNTVEAKAEDGNEDTDTAKFCIGEEGEVLGVEAMPPTGSSPLFGLISLVVAGVGACLTKRK